MVASKLEVDPDDLVVRNGTYLGAGHGRPRDDDRRNFLRQVRQSRYDVAAEAVCQPRQPTGPETGQSEKCTEYWFPSATAAEVEVDTETGQVKILQLFSVGDTGTAINPRHCEQQLQGAAIMHLGLTLFEEMIFDQGNSSMARCWITRSLRLKTCRSPFGPSLSEVPHADGPFGAKGAGETGALTVAPAIANAIHDAVGMRIRELPITPEKVLRALVE